jgi:hypothetical protein
MQTPAATGATPAGSAQVARAETAFHTLHPREGWPVCSCGTPMHPEHLDHRHGKLLERYHCPRRHWWNAWSHPHAWLQPRPGAANP